MTSGKLPCQAAINKMYMEPVPSELQHLNMLEQQLISLTIPFMKVVQSPKGKQARLCGPVISVRSSPQVITSSLPRPLGESQIVGIKNTSG